MYKERPLSEKLLDAYAFLDYDPERRSIEHPIFLECGNRALALEAELAKAEELSRIRRRALELACDESWECMRPFLDQAREEANSC